MRPIHGTLLLRKDLCDEFAKVPFNEIKPEMFGLIRNKIIFNDDILIFMDDDQKSKIIKKIDMEKTN